VLVGLDAKVLDVVVRVLGSRYQRVLALTIGKVMPGSTNRPAAPATEAPPSTTRVNGKTKASA
jgi:hypothetical protein